MIGSGNLHVLHIVRSFDISGRSRMIHDLCRRLAAGRFRCRVAVLADHPCGYDQRDVEVTCLGAGKGFRPRAILTLMKIIREEGISVVHNHGRGALLHAAAAAGLSPGCRLVHTIHRADGDRITNRRPLGRLLCSRVDAFTAVSDAAAREFAAVNGIPVNRIRVIYNGIDLTRFPRTMRESESSRPRIGRSASFPVLGAIMNLSPDKDFDTLLKGFRLILKSHPDARLRIAGHGPGEAGIRRCAADLGVQDRVELLGFRNDVPRLLAEFDVLIHSARTEGLGIVLLEAMAAGVPVVAGDVGGIPEIVENEVTGMLVKPGHAEALAAAALNVLADETMRTRMIRSARDRVEERFSWQVMCLRYEELYSRLSAEHGDGPRSKRRV